MRKVAINAAWNIGGQLVSISAGLVTLPVLLHALGTARLGVFTLALGLIGFSGIFDLGLSRALTQSVSSLLGKGRTRAMVAALVWRVIMMLAALGIPWTIAIWVGAPFIADRLFSLSGDLADETVLGLHALALSIPFALAATGALGALEGLQQFRLLSLWRAPMSVVQLVMPTLLALWSPNIGLVIAALAVTRVLWLALWLACLHRQLPVRGGMSVDRNDLRHALHFGGWLSVSNMIGPLMTYADRFYLASQISPVAVAYYAVPFDAVTRVSSLPQTAVSALFPALAESQDDAAISSRLLAMSFKAILILMFLPILVATLLSHPLLAIWLGPNFAAPAAPILKLLLLGVFLNAAAFLPYSLLQAHGRSDITAKLHLLELPFFALLLVWLVHILGAKGAALAWTLRVALDAILLYSVAAARYRLQRKVLLNGSACVAVAAAGLFLAAHIEYAALQSIAAGVATVIWVGMATQGLRRYWREGRAGGG